MTMNVPFMDLRIIDNDERDALSACFTRLMDHGRYIMGHEVDQFERDIADYCQRSYAIGVSSGTDALYMSLRSLGVGPGDEVITTSLSWIATANAIAMTGASPVFADIDESLNLSLESVKHLISARTKVILPVHYTGRCVDISGFESLSEETGIPLLYDAAQAFGSTYRDRPVGSYGELCCFSLNPMKVLGACGEAGVILTDNKALYESLQILRYNGTINKEVCVKSSLNGRIDTLQAAILSIRLRLVGEKIRKRKAICALYDELLPDSVGLPTQDSQESVSAYYSYTIRVNERESLIELLRQKGIETKIQHPILMCDQAPYRDCKNDVGERTRSIVAKILCIPANETVTHEDASYVADCIRQFYE